MKQVTGELDHLDIRYTLSIPDDVLDRAREASDLFSQYAVPLADLTSEICLSIVESGIPGEFRLHCTGRPLASLLPPSPPEDTLTVTVSEDGHDHDGQFDIVDNDEVCVESAAYRFELGHDRVEVTFPDTNVEYRRRPHTLDESVEDYYYGTETNESYLGREGTPSDRGTIGLVDEDDVETHFWVKTTWNGRIVVYLDHSVAYHKGPGVPSQPIATIDSSFDS